MTNPFVALFRALGRFYHGNRRLLLLYLLPIALVQARAVNYGFIGDESAYVAPNTEDLAAHPLIPFVLQGVDTGHPMLYAYPVALFWRFFGQSNAAANISIWLWAAIALVALHRLMQAILARMDFADDRRKRLWGGAAALALFCTPQFISLAGQYLDPVPYLALLLCMVLAWVHGRRASLALLACMVSLTRITACLSVLGLGLFDLGYTWFVLRRRSARDLARALAPYAVSALVFSAYLAFKLFVLGRPLSNIEVNKFEVGAWDDIRLSTLRVLGVMLRIPRFSFTPLLAVAAAGLLFAVFRRKKSSQGELPLVPGAASIHAACFATMAVPTLFYCLYPHFPQPRYMLPWQAFIVLWGIHGLRLLAGRRRWLALAFLLPWCALQVARWQASWVPRGLAFIPATQRAHLRIDPAFCLDVLDRKELSHKAGRWIKNKRPPGAALVAAYPTQSVFTTRPAGFIKPLKDVFLASMIRRDNPDADFRLILDGHPATYVVQASWDLSDERLHLDSLMRGKPFKVLVRFRTPSGEWIRISCYQKPSVT